MAIESSYHSRDKGHLTYIVLDYLRNELNLAPTNISFTVNRIGGSFEVTYHNDITARLFESVGVIEALETHRRRMGFGVTNPIAIKTTY